MPAPPIPGNYAGCMAPQVSKTPVNHVAVVGAGDCGTRVALALRAHGFAGQLTLISNEQHSPYERPTLSKTVLSYSAEPPTIRTIKQLENLNVTFLEGSPVTDLHPATGEVTLQNGACISADRIVLATGARARRPPLGTEVVHTLRSLSDAHRLRDELNPGTSVVIIGGGFIGLEVAAAARARDCDVTVVEFAHRLMTRVVPSRVSDAIRTRHETAGVRILTGAMVSSINATANGAKPLTIKLGDGTVLMADVIVAGLGALPNTELAGAAGLLIDNGIAVNETLQTSCLNVYAAGDCCSFPYQLSDGKRVRLEAWRNAVDMADVVARNIVGMHTIFTKVPWFWSDQFELQLQVAGLHEESTNEVLRQLKDGTEVWFGLNATGRVVSASGVSESAAFGRTISIAERLIAERASPTPAVLADPNYDLRKLLSSS
jgi:3-phenylpropionate/trans-cinnamate dioxygenase ferredoxin reductase component